MTANLGSVVERSDAPAVTASRVARRLGISPPTFRKLVREGRVPVLRVGSVNRYDLAEVLQALRGPVGPIQPQAPAPSPVKELFA